MLAGLLPDVIWVIGSLLGISLTAIKIYEWATSRKRKEELIKTIREAVERGRFYLHWNCEVDIKNFEGHTLETNEVAFVNLASREVKKTWHHIWGDERFFKSLKQYAHDEKNNELKITPLTKEPTHMRISVKFKEPAQPLKPYGYTWIQEYKQFKDLEHGEWFEFQQESLIKDLKIKILYPPNAIATSKSVYCYTFENGDKIPLKQLEVKRDRKKKNRQYVELELDEIEANRILRFEFSAKPAYL